MMKPQKQDQEKNNIRLCPILDKIGIAKCRKINVVTYKNPPMLSFAKHRGISLRKYQLYDGSLTVGFIVQDSCDILT